MKPERHIETINASIEVIEAAIKKGVQRWQPTIGFQTSYASAEMFELYLHEKAGYPVTARLNHKWLKSIKRINEKLPANFPRKEEIVRLVYLIEKNRDKICYGKKMEEEFIMEQIEMFYKLKNIMKEEGFDEIE